MGYWSLMESLSGYWGTPAGLPLMTSAMKGGAAASVREGEELLLLGALGIV